MLGLASSIYYILRTGGSYSILLKSSITTLRWPRRLLKLVLDLDISSIVVVRRVEIEVEVGVEIGVEVGVKRRPIVKR
jgi:hypothetical protein